MLEIKLSRHYDGRYIAAIPGLHPACLSVCNTAEAAIRGVQVNAFNLMSDFVRGNRSLPDSVSDWFHITTANGDVSVGGHQTGKVDKTVLVHPDFTTIPKRPRSSAKPNLPKHGTPEYHQLLVSLNPPAQPVAAETQTTAASVPAPTTVPTLPSEPTQ